ncbi:MAG: prepilin-type N-terminal cleavage/methylation domain-containing protein [Candidatus Riflebacteria bacterium]|nr:prepilin-type N-terminal cleavage/methylation domain-containing protein [Candidatus Riflebacteria bacterium]
MHQSLRAVHSDINVRNSSGFTMIELVVATVIGVIIMGSVYMLMTTGMRQTTKGRDLLDAIREAHQLFSFIRRDMLASVVLQAPSLTDPLYSVTLDVNDTDMPPMTGTNYVSTLVFGFSNATATYQLKTDSKGYNYIQRTLVSGSGGPSAENHQFAVRRMKSFRALVVRKKHNTAQGKSPFNTRHLFFQIILQSDSTQKNLSQKEVVLTSFFTPSNVVISDWNAW